MANEGKNGKKEGTVIKITPSLPAKLGRVYSNFIEISHSPFDFTVRFCDAPPGSDIPKLKKSGNEVEVPTIVEVVLPVNVVPALIKALSEQNEKYLEEFQPKERHEKDR